MSRRAIWLVIGALWLHQLAIAILSPLSFEDWKTAIRGPWWTLVGVLHWVIVESRIAHAVLSPLLIVAAVVGLATLARGRRLRADGDDALLVLVIASALWLAVPQLGLACSYRFAAATHVIAMTAAVWYVIGFRAVAARARAGAAIGPWTVAGLLLGGVIAGATTRPLATATLATCAVIAARAGAPRRWAIAGLAGVAAGAALAWLSDLHTMRIFLEQVDVDAQLHTFDVQTRSPIWIGAATATLWLASVAWRRWRGRPPRALGDRAIDVIGGGVALAVCIAVLGLVTAEFTGFLVIEPGAAVAVIAAVVVLELFGTGRGRTVILVIALAVQARVGFGSLRALLDAHRDFERRVATLERAPRGTVASVPPYPRHATTWFLGEDFRYSQLRDRVATRIFGLRGIALAPARREYQDVPPLALHHEVDGDARGFPGFYSADLVTAREQFGAAVEQRPGRARLIADGLTVPDRPGQPVLAAWTTAAGRPAWWSIEDSDSDFEGRVILAPTGADLGPHAVWAFDLATGAGEPLPRGDDGLHRFQPSRRMAAGIVVCDPARCALSLVILVN